MKIRNTRRQMRGGVAIAILFGLSIIAVAAPGKVDDPLGILRKPIPERLVVRVRRWRG